MPSLCSNLAALATLEHLCIETLNQMHPALLAAALSVPCVDTLECTGIPSACVGELFAGLGNKQHSLRQLVLGFVGHQAHDDWGILMEGDPTATHLLPVQLKELRISFAPHKASGMIAQVCVTV